MFSAHDSLGFPSHCKVSSVGDTRLHFPFPPKFDFSAPFAFSVKACELGPLAHSVSPILFATLETSLG